MKKDNITGVSQLFENEFLKTKDDGIEKNLKNNVLAPRFIELFKDSKSVLEAGCGDGRWNAFLSQHNIPNTGLDWSEKLCEQGRQKSPSSRFVSGDLNCTPFENEEFDGIISLGAIEHNAAGPQQALHEFYRLLEPGGKAIITVPSGSFIRKTRRVIYRIIPLKHREYLQNIKKFGAKKKYWPRFKKNEKGNFFYEYEFNKKQFTGFIKDAGFVIDETFVFDQASGIYNTFWPLAGKAYTANLNWFGRILKVLLPCSISGHMIGCVVHKS